MNLFIYNELFTNGFNHSILDVLSIFILLSGIFVIVSSNPIISVLFLISLFGGVSLYLIAVGLNFIGFSYLIVYIGAISILFLFILMLINIRVSELQSNTKNSVPLGIFISIFLSYWLFKMLPYNLNGDNYLISLSEVKNSINNDLYYITNNNWEINLAETSHISSIGNLLYTSHNLWLIVVSLILLLAMVGSILITLSGRR